jgi:hypothetical protein
LSYASSALEPIDDGFLQARSCAACADLAVKRNASLFLMRCHQASVLQAARQFSRQGLLSHSRTRSQVGTGRQSIPGACEERLDKEQKQQQRLQCIETDAL